VIFLHNLPYRETLVLQYHDTIGQVGGKWGRFLTAILILNLHLRGVNRHSYFARTCAMLYAALRQENLQKASLYRSVTMSAHYGTMPKLELLGS